MKIPDVNLLLYALDERSPHHARARSWVEQVLSGTETVGLSWQVLVAFVRLSTRHAVFEQPLTVHEAFDVVDGWLDQPPVTVVHPGRRHAAVLRELLAALGTAGNLTTDAHLAALAVEHGAELCSHDRDFGRFPGVRWVDPLA
ncbi:MAG TPA: type II toxin-antitoxin system VapC family toxin [Mycobacteriales bacterium]|nr:type II toxin-antitoxin system VapC family toxin [Mycobacteriales bacterium]